MALFKENKIKFLCIIILCSFLFEITSHSFFIIYGDKLENVENEEEGKKENETEIEVQPKITYNYFDFLSSRYKNKFNYNIVFSKKSQKLESSFIYSIDLPPELI